MKPILFNTADVRAIQDGRKTMMRRVVKDIPSEYLFCGLEENPVVVYENDPFDGEHTLKGLYATFEATSDAYIEFPMRKAPYQPGDILYVRETWFRYEQAHIVNDLKYAYKADISKYRDKIQKEYGYKWRSSIHMPKEAARIFLRVKSVRVERLHKITKDDIIKEGVIPRNLKSGGCKCAWAVDGCLEEPCPNRDAYERLRYTIPFAEYWDDPIKPADRDRYGWGANPWAWVIEFERISREEAYGTVR